MNEHMIRTAVVAQALAHPMRLRILELLRDDGAYVMHLTARLQRPQANVSQHLAILREAGLVRDERVGMSVIYRVVDKRIFDVIEQMQMLKLSQNSATHEPAGAYGEWGGPGLRRQRGRGGPCHCPRCQEE